MEIFLSLYVDCFLEDMKTIMLNIQVSQWSKSLFSNVITSVFFLGGCLFFYRQHLRQYKL